MKASHIFSVGSGLPEVLAPLHDIVENLRWCWHVPSAELFRWIDPVIWEASKRNPAAVLDRVAPSRLVALAKDSRFIEQMNREAADLERYKTADGYFQLTYPKDNFRVAYFSPEFGITESLPQYSGGLGVLAGDHLKCASSLGIPIIGVGLYYRDGYFGQSIRSDGWQVESYFHDTDMDRLVSNKPEHRFTMPFANETLNVAIRIVTVGRIQLCLLDTDLESNEVPMRNVSDRLYGGDLEHRLAQEILLGIGGVRALETLGIHADIFHMNEGHAGFLTVERMSSFMKAGLTFEQAAEATRATTMFTTHTPVPAGIDRFPVGLLAKYLEPYFSSIGLSFDEFLKFGSASQHDSNSDFNMAHLGFRLSGKANAVSLEHEVVSKELFAPLWPSLDESQIPIGHVTNGVHGRSWTSPEMDELLSKTLLDSWPEADAKEYDRLLSVNPMEFAVAKRAGKVRLIDELERRSKANSTGRSLDGIVMPASTLNADSLIIGFARRFAPYKRATLLLRDPERLLKILKDPSRPVTFLFAGKAHPADDPGKGLIHDIVNFARENGVSDRFKFVQDYDIALARALYHGCDVWLNTPRRPLEASGTSGMKAAMNGTLNCSILDGWWAECYNGQNGFAPQSAPEGLSDEEIDAFEAASLFSVLEDQLIPLYFQRDQAGDRRSWYELVRYSMVNLVPFISGARMVKDYTDDYYVPLARRSKSLFAHKYADLKKLVEWKGATYEHFGSVQIYSFDVLPGGSGSKAEDVNEAHSRELHIEVSSAGFHASDIKVEVVYGPVLPGSTEFSTYDTVEAKFTGSYMSHRELEGDSTENELTEVNLYTVEFDTKVGGSFGYLIQVTPRNSQLISEFEMGLRVSS